MSFRQTTYADNQDEVLPGFLKWIGIADALDIPDDQLPRAQPSEVDRILGGSKVDRILVGSKHQPPCQDICPLAKDLQDQVRDAAAERAYSRIFCLEQQLQERPGHRKARETMATVKSLFDIADRAWKSHSLTKDQLKLASDIRKIHTRSIQKLL